MAGRRNRSWDGRLELLVDLLVIVGNPEFEKKVVSEWLDGRCQGCLFVCSLDICHLCHEVNHLKWLKLKNARQRAESSPNCTRERDSQCLPENECLCSVRGIRAPAQRCGREIKIWMCLTVSDHFPKQHVRREAQKHPRCVTISVESSQRLILYFQLIVY